MIYKCYMCDNLIDERTEHLYGDFGVCEECDRKLMDGLQKLCEEEQA